MLPYAEQPCYIRLGDPFLEVFEPASIPASVKPTIPWQHLISVCTPPDSPQPLILTAPLGPPPRAKLRPRFSEFEQEGTNEPTGSNEHIATSSRLPLVRSSPSHHSSFISAPMKRQFSRSSNEAKVSSSRPPLLRSKQSHHPSIISAPIKKQLSRGSNISKVTRANLLYYLIATNEDFKVPIDNRKGAKLHPEDPEDLRLIAEMFGERKFFVFDIEEVCCRDCVEGKDVSEAQPVNTKETITTLKSKFTTMFHQPGANHSNPFTSLTRPYLPYHCRHKPPPMLFTLFRTLGHQTCTLISKIRLVGNFSLLDSTLSAISNLLTIFTCLSAFRITLHSPKKGKIGLVEARQLARVFAGIEKQLPDGERLHVERLRDHRHLKKEWDKKKRGWWLVNPGGNHARMGLGMEEGWKLDYRDEEEGEDMLMLRAEMMPTIMRAA